MSMEPIQLRDLIQSLASIMVGTGRYLDQANVELRSLYATAGGGALATLTPPRYTLDEASVEIAFVIEEAKADSEEAMIVRIPEATWTEWSSEEDRTLRDHLEAQEKLRLDQLTLAHADARTRREEAQRRLAEAERRLAEFEQQERRIHDQLHRLPLPIIPPQVRKELERLQQARGQLQDERQKLAQQCVESTRIAEAAQAELTRAQGPSSPLSLEPSWSDFLSDREALRDLHDEVRTALESKSLLPRIRPLRHPAAALVDALKSDELKPAALRKKVAILLDEYEARFAEIGDAVRRVAELATRGIRVRVDPEVVASVPDNARQRIRLTFRTQGQETIHVEGQPVDIR